MRAAENDEILVVAGLGVTAQQSTVLEGVSFRVRKGTTTAIVGPNGGGKTTLFRALLGLTSHTGEVTWREGVKIGYVPQTLVSTDLPISVEEFLRFKCRTDFSSCLRSVGLSRDMLGRRLGALSGGELQRVLIAWAIADRPGVLLFDEPTSGVDIGAEEPIYQEVDQLRKELGITTLLISHNMHVVMHYSDHVLALNKRVLYFGESRNLDHEQLLNIIYGTEFPIPRHERQRE